MKRLSQTARTALCCLFSWSMAVPAVEFGGGYKGKLTIHVMDEEGKPVPGIRVAAGHMSTKVGRVGTSDRNGLFVLEDRSTVNTVTYAIRQEGYYFTSGEYNFLGVDEKNMMFLPWNPAVTAVVRRVINPIPMYAKRVETKVPATNRWYGFDLQVADWTSPAGKGVVSDLMVRVDGFWKDYRANDSVLTVAAARAGDGLRLEVAGATSSAFLMSREAPREGYTNAVRWRKARSPRDGDGNDVIVDETQEANGILFRVRSFVDAGSATTNALYGKIRPGLSFGGAGSEGSYLTFTYYLNPAPNDRNLEFDTQRNLFKNLEPPERVRTP